MLVKSRHTVQDTQVFLICLMSWGGRFFLKGDKRLDLFCFILAQVPFEDVLVEVYNTLEGSCGILKQKHYIILLEKKVQTVFIFILGQLINK